MLFNSAVYLPKEMIKHLPDNIRDVVYCPHAKQKAKERNIKLPRNIFGGQIVEVELDRDEIVKAVYRVRYSKYQDITLVFHVIDGIPAIVRTLWINEHGREKKINPDRYCNGI